MSNVENLPQKYDTEEKIKVDDEVVISGDREQISLKSDSVIFEKQKNQDLYQKDVFGEENEKKNLLRSDLRYKIDLLRGRNKIFKDFSRALCCGSFTFSLFVVLFLFYIFDNLKYEATCAKSKKFIMEICDAPSINFWPRFFFIIIVGFLITLGLYCTGATVVSINPKKNIVSINKKKLVFLPSIHDYEFNKLKGAMVEDDSNPNSSNNITSITFSSVILVFEDKSNQENKTEFVNLGFGRDFFCIDAKANLTNEINDYLKALKMNIDDDNSDYLRFV